MKRFLLPIALLLIAILFLGTSSVYALNKMNWSPRNYEVLSKFIKDYGVGGKYYDKKNPPYVTLDWDQTMGHLDCEEATFRHQLWNLKFKMSKAEFKALFKDEINGVKQLNADYKNIKLADINVDIVSAYEFLHDNYVGFGVGKMTIEEIRETPQFKDFITKMPFLYDGYCETAGIEAVYGYPWVLFFLAGHTVEEVQALAKDAFTFALNDKLTKVTWKAPCNFACKAGPIDYTYKSGLRVHPEMQDLTESMMRAGIDVYICSASLKEVVQTYGAPGNFGYNIDPKKVIAMELEVKNNILLPQYKTGWVQTQRMGKVEAIKKVLGHRGDPIFSAGDSDGDYEMITEFKGMKLALIFNRLKGGPIGQTSKLAVEQMKDKTPRFILQGRNENTGLLLPQSESILLGKSEAKLLK